MKRFALLLSMLLLVCSSAYADKKKKANEDTNTFRYDIEYCKTAADGQVVVKVWSYSKKADIATQQSRKNAVHGVIFRGYVAEQSFQSQSPLVSDASIESRNADFFEAFFDDEAATYARYVTKVVDSATEIRKVGKEYKVGVVVTVNKGLLRKHLEEAGIIRGLSTGF